VFPSFETGWLETSCSEGYSFGKHWEPPAVPYEDSVQTRDRDIVVFFLAALA
jgi:hypothetical protein